MSKEVNLIFPHQLFEKSPLIDNGHICYLIEEYLFFNQYKFHKQKIAYHRATMKFYEQHLNKNNSPVNYISAQEEICDVRKLIIYLSEIGVTKIHIADPTDDWLQKRIHRRSKENGIEVQTYSNQIFLNKKDDLQPFFRNNKKKYFQTSWYIDERKRRRILIDQAEQPIGGKWSYDADNRKKFPRDRKVPKINFPPVTDHHKEAIEYVEKYYDENPGEIDEQPLYPIDYTQTQAWFDDFLENRFSLFGDYEDAIVQNESILHHSVLTPMLNIGLISPDSIIKRSVNFADKNNVPINSLEGFIRQIIGWREFIRGVYEAKGVEERTKNFWGFNRKIPVSFYDGTTGVVPLDETIKKALKSGYCHHIERLMILGNFMLLCEFDPDEVYRWFMELFIDAYDWVMVPNVYGMSQFADGGLMSTKPYISGSNYVMKMSNYKKGEWQVTWDGLFWRFMSVHRNFFESNPRIGMLVRTWDRMNDDKKTKHLDAAEEFLQKLDE